MHSSPLNDNNESYGNVPEIPIEIVSEEEMAFIEAALASARPSLSSALATVASSSSSPCSGSQSFLSLTQFASTRSVQAISLFSKRRLSSCTEPTSVGDIEDSGDFSNTQKKVRVTETLLHRFRRKRGLSVTDVTATEWCEKQMEFVLLLGKQKRTQAMKSGSFRHAKLEEEVVKRVRVQVKSVEDIWAVKLMNFIVGVHQLLFEGLTRELPLISFVEGTWMVGIIDEIQMPSTEASQNPKLLDTKTRVQSTLPAEPQRRNGRLQLMCYKYMWDNLVADNFPSNQFFDFFTLNPHYILSEEIQQNTAKSGIPAKTLDDLVRYYRNTCCMLPPADDQLILRYEHQKDNSLLGEDEFTYDSGWLKTQIQSCLEFWLGEREANYTPEEERWKCRFCRFSSVCPANAKANDGTKEQLSISSH